MSAVASSICCIHTFCIIYAVTSCWRRDRHSTRNDEHTCADACGPSAVPSVAAACFGVPWSLRLPAGSVTPGSVVPDVHALATLDVPLEAESHGCTLVSKRVTWKRSNLIARGLEVSSPQLPCKECHTSDRCSLHCTFYAPSSSLHVSAGVNCIPFLIEQSCYAASVSVAHREAQSASLQLTCQEKVALVTPCVSGSAVSSLQ